MRNAAQAAIVDEIARSGGQVLGHQAILEDFLSGARGACRGSRGSRCLGGSESRQEGDDEERKLHDAGFVFLRFGTVQIFSMRLFDFPDKSTTAKRKTRKYGMEYILESHLLCPRHGMYEVIRDGERNNIASPQTLRDGNYTHRSSSTWPTMCLSPLKVREGELAMARVRTVRDWVRAGKGPLSAKFVSGWFPRKLHGS